MKDIEKVNNSVIIATPNVSSFPLKVNRFGNDFCVVYFHGLFGSSSHKHVVHLVDDLNKNKIDNCTFDFFAHGERASKEPFIEFDTFKYVEETKMAIHTLKSLGYKNFIFIGESFGGLLLQTLKSTKIDCIGVVHLFSIFDFNYSNINIETIEYHYNNNIPLVVSSTSGARKSELSKRLLHGIMLFQKDIENIAIQNREIPTLIIAGKYDSECQYHGAIEFAKKLNEVKCKIYNTGHNGYDKITKQYSYNNTKRINAEIIRFIKALIYLKLYFKK